MANAGDARQVLADVAARRDVPTLTRALTAVLDAAELSADPEVLDRLGASSDHAAGFDAGVQYAADLAVAALRGAAGTPTP